MVKVAVLVSGGGTNLQALLDYDSKNYEIALVVSNRKDAYALQRATLNNIKAVHIAKENFEKNLIDCLKEYNIEVVVLAGFLKILSLSFIEHFENRIINIHPSLIPSFCGKGYYGLKVHEEALKRGVKLTGATVHLVNEIPDGGRILMQKAVEVHDDDTPEVLQKRVMKEAEWVIFPQAVDMLCKEVENENSRLFK